MGKTTSRWRESAREVIARVLAALPADATEKDKRRALRDSYPFGLRENHPYKAWLAEVRAALGPSRKKEEPKGPSVAYYLSLRPVAKDVRVPWLSVYCRWCNVSVQTLRGCLACGKFYDRATEAVRAPEWRAFQAAGKDDPEAVLGMAADWLRERGVDPLEVVDA